MPLLIGAIADDFTGATDLANTLVKEGMRTLQTIGVPRQPIDLDGIDAIIVALKTRTIPASEAVKESLTVLDWLQRLEVRQVFFKYCSTFDSTDSGNIGPVADALLQALDTEMAIVCPAFPTNERTIYNGNLFVGDVLLSESSMKDHPLTPMTDANLVRLMGRQSQRDVGLVPYRTVTRGHEAIEEALIQLRSSGKSYGVVDAINDENLRVIGRAAEKLRLITGGSGVALGLPENFRRKGWLEKNQTPLFPAVSGGAVVFSGSCSVATRRQLEYVSEKWPVYRIDPAEIAGGHDVAEMIVDWSRTKSLDTPIVIYSSSNPEDVASVQEKYGREKAGLMIENLFAEIAGLFPSEGRRKIIVAGGETSGAIVTALGVEALKIGPEIDPGVPWCETCGDTPLALALKSGNFGSVDFFEKALGYLS